MDADSVSQICSDYGLWNEEVDPRGKLHEVWNRRTFGLTEKEILLDVHGCAHELLQKDREAERKGKRRAVANKA